MPRTTTEKQISRARKSQSKLIPLIEERMRRPVDIDGRDDVNFISDLLRKSVEREQERRQRYRYSPSMLAECLRKVYLHRHYKGPRVKQTRIEPNFYFLTGDWLHVKWQFVLWKMDREGVSGFKLIDCEIPVVSKHGDHGGTLDAVVEIWDEWLGLDFKGLNVRSFQQAVQGTVDLAYKIQLADYIMLWNSDPSKRPLNGGLIVVENKGGPDQKHPLPLVEIPVSLGEHRSEIRMRLGALREHEKQGTIPEPACQSTQTLQFQGCAFRKFCREEVLTIQKRNAKDRDTTEHRIRISDRNGRNRPGRNKQRRRNGSS